MALSMIAGHPLLVGSRAVWSTRRRSKSSILQVCPGAPCARVSQNRQPAVALYRDIVCRSFAEPGAGLPFSVAMSSTATLQPKPQLRRELLLFDGITLVAGTIIGSGIFLVPNTVAHQLTSVAAVVLLWVCGAVLTLFGALSLSELAAAFPSAGGIYVYLRQAYGPAAGFLYGWAAFVAMESGSAATLASALSIYLAQFITLSPAGHRIVSVICVMLFTAVNCVGLRAGKFVQNVFTVSKVLGLAAVILILLTHARPAVLVQNFWPAGLHAAPSAFATALIAALWAYQGWHSVCYVASEFRNPKKDLPRSLLAGTLVVAAVYILANVGYYAVLSPGEVRESSRVAATALTQAVGPAAASVLSVLILISIVGAANGTTLTAARAYYAMAEDGLFFKSVARVHPRFRTPVTALLISGAWSSVLVLVGTFQQLFTYVIFSGWIFYAMAVAAVMVLRRRCPDLPRPYRVIGYPWVPLTFIAAAALLTINTIASDLLHSLLGIAVILLGVPVYFFFFRNQVPQGAQGRSTASE